MGTSATPIKWARVFGAHTPECNPGTRTSRSLMYCVVGDLGSPDTINAAETTYVSRYRQLAAFRAYALGVRVDHQSLVQVFVSATF